MPLRISLRLCARCAAAAAADDVLCLLVFSQHTEKWILKLTAEMDQWLEVLVRHQADKVGAALEDLLTQAPTPLLLG